MATEERIGIVTHYYPRAHAAAVEIDHGAVHVGDRLHIAGRGVDLRETVKSLQLDHEPIEEGRAGQTIGVGLSKPVPRNADVFVIHGQDEKVGFWKKLFGG